MGTKHIGDLIITTAEQAKSYAHIEEVTGYLDISADAQLPALTSVGGSLYISADAQLPVLTSVGGYLDIRADAQLPALTSVGGSEITMHPICALGLHYSVTILDQTMRIGCQEHALSDWASFDNAQIAEMDGKQALTFWAEQKTKLLDFAAEHGRVISKEVA